MLIAKRGGSAVNRDNLLLSAKGGGRGWRLTKRMHALSGRDSWLLQLSPLSPYLPLLLPLLPLLSSCDTFRCHSFPFLSYYYYSPPTAAVAAADTPVTSCSIFVTAAAAAA